MTNLEKLSLICIILLVASNMLFAGGREITVFTSSHQIVFGELLSARETGLVLTNVMDLSDTELGGHPEWIILVPVTEIDSIRAEGHSHVLAGLGIGAGAGLATGLIVGAAVSNDVNHNSSDYVPVVTEMSAGMSGAAAAVLCLGGGIVLGTIVGAVASSGDIMIAKPDPTTLLSLRPDSRYALAEPAFISNVK